MRNHRPSPSPLREPLAPLRWALVVLAGLLLAPGFSGRAAEPPSQAVLHLRNGGYVPGELVDSDRPGTLRWQPTAFVDPFEFGWSYVDTIQFRPTGAALHPAGPSVVELVGGDILFGTLVELDDRWAVLDLAQRGRLRIERSAIQRIDFRRAGSGLIYLGPNGLVGWHNLSPERPWREEAGQVVSDRPGAIARADLGIPPRALIEFQISWKSKPDFVLALGVDDQAETLKRAFRFEVWENSLVVHREIEAEADVASLQELPAGAGRTRLLAYLDQEKGRIVAVSPAGKVLADMTLPDKPQRSFPGLLLTGNEGGVRLERLRISRWTGPAAVGFRDEPRLHLADGSVLYGQVTRFDAPARQFVVRKAGSAAETRIAENDVVAMGLSSATGDTPTQRVRLTTRDGARLHGEVSRIDQGRLALSVPGIADEILIPAADLLSLAVQRQDKTPAENDSPMRLLLLDDVRLFGRIAEPPGAPQAGRLGWQPMGSATGSALRPGFGGKIDSNWWNSSTTAPQPGQVAAAELARANERAILLQRRTQTRTVLSRLPQPRLLYLRAGDVLPAEVIHIDEQGVSIRSPLSETALIPHRHVKAVELELETALGPGLSKAKLDRLLTLPRLQKDSPPTHLVGSTSGDYLRGRLIRMDEKSLQIEVRLDVKEVPRDRVARIIWLHPELREAAPDRPDGPDGLLVQAVCRNGIRLTFSPERVEKDSLLGKSEVLGRCKVLLKDLDSLLIGKGIDQGSATLAYHDWTLHNAPDPQVLKADEGGTPIVRNPGTSSALVGKPAPDFELDLLGGETFRLAASKGKVVVLDFWASWCGPCLQAMPQVDRVTREFRDRGVELIAVNLQETPKQVTALLERQKMQLTVALDREGRVAEKYKATAIPQTVIIDRDGTIARLFVGSSPHLGDDLREALNAVLSGASEDPPAAR